MVEKSRKIMKNVGQIEKYINDATCYTVCEFLRTEGLVSVFYFFAFYPILLKNFSGA